VELSGKVAIVTGGGTGIGRACALMLAQSGAAVVVAGRRGAPLDDVVRAVQERGGTALAVAADLRHDADARSVVQRALDGFGRLDLAVNAAGGVGVGALVDTEEAEFDDMVAASLKTTFLALRHEIPAIAAAGGGAVVNVSSRAGLAGVANGSAYSAAKHGVIGLTKSAALETAALGIRVNAVCPGPTRTDQFERIVEQIVPGVPMDAAAAEFGGKLPLGRIARPEEVAATVLWLLGPAASFVTGTTVAVDGGGGAG
jgi:NAD(P)-dependent dehydrogenase (short-subunit alcohol dehydrogenase family)